MAFLKVVFALGVIGAFCWHQYNRSSISVISADKLTLDLTSRQLKVKSDFRGKSLVLQGYMGGSLPEDELPEPCADDQQLKSVANRHCLKWPNKAKLDIKVKKFDRGTCYAVQWSSLNPNFRPHDCFDLQRAHWYGGPEVYHQYWPIEKQESMMQPFVSADFLSSEFVENPTMGKYGNIIEPYWISSLGAGIRVDENVPLHTSWNDHGDDELCLRADPVDLINPADWETHLPTLAYTICTAANVKTIHTLMSSRFLPKPTALPDSLMFKSPIWSTWARYKTAIDQNKTLEYAQEILDNGFSNSQIEIDDMYTPTYGDIEFDLNKFPDAKGMIAKLHEMGFRVTCWLTPFANLNSKAFLEGASNGYWLQNLDREAPSLVNWWQGIGAVLDVTNPEAVHWFVQSLESFKLNTGMDSFKFDAGEISHTPSYFTTKQELATVNHFTTRYASDVVAAMGPMVELRSGFRSQSLPVFVRMMDKHSSWGYENGLQTMIPTALMMSIAGYHFNLPDMIGGNAYSMDGDFSKTVLPERELFIRWVQLCAYLPAMQFSVAPWQYDDEVVRISLDAVKIHEQVVTPIVLKAAAQSVKSGTPIIRPLWWLDPDDVNCLVLDSQFLVGASLLVAPILEMGGRSRDIYLPRGNWKDNLRGEVLNGQQWLRSYEVELDEIASFNKLR